jgi:DNA-binding response OmpR family regulator
MRASPTPGARVLVVEDDIDLAFAIGKIIERRGHSVRIVNDGRLVPDALEDFNPQAVVLDLGLPGMDGYDVIRLMRQDPKFASALIVVVSGHDKESDKQKSKAAGADNHLSKPVDFDELLAILEKVAVEHRRLDG